MSKEEFDRITPVSPPIVNKKIKPNTHNKVGLILKLDPCNVAIQLNTLTPVGMAITMVAAVK